MVFLGNNVAAVAFVVALRKKELDLSTEIYCQSPLKSYCFPHAIL